MDRPDRRTFLRASAGAVGLSAASTDADTGVAQDSTSTLSEPPESPNAVSNDLGDESSWKLWLSIGAFVGGWVAFLWALRVSGEDS